MIEFENEYGDSVEELSNPLLTQALINVVKGEELTCESISIIWVDDEELRNMHIQFLDDPTYTDIMTFNLGDENTLEIELYISVDRAIDHSKKFKVSLLNELSRLLIHGMLHLSGYDDHTEHEQKEMRQRENHYLNFLL